MANKELAVINSVLEKKDIAVLFSQSVDDLFRAYSDAWSFIKDYYAKHRSVPDIEILQEQPRFDDLEYVRTTAPTQYYLDSLREEYIASRTQQIMLTAEKARVEGMTATQILSSMQAALTKLHRFSGTSRDLNVMDTELAEEHYEEVRKRAEEMGGVPGIKTGIDFFDSGYTSGLAGGDLIIVLGYTGRKKSFFTTLVACNAYSQGYRPMIVSMEMSGEKVRDRIYTIMGSGLFRNSELALGDINVDNFRTFKTRHNDDREFMVVNHDGLGELTPTIVQAKVDEYRPDILILDYAQLMSDNAGSNDMVSKMRNMANEYKQMAMAYDIPIVLISSATPDSNATATEPPRVEQVAYSKQLAYNADLAIAVHGHDGTNMVEIVARKNRNGEQFAGYLNWNIDEGIYEEVYDI